MLNGGRLSFSDDESGALQTIQQKIARNKYMQIISNFQYENLCMTLLFECDRFYHNTTENEFLALFSMISNVKVYGYTFRENDTNFHFASLF